MNGLRAPNTVNPHLLVATRYFCASSLHFHCACDASKSVVSHSLLLPSWTLPMTPSVDRILAPENCVRLRKNNNHNAHENAFRQWLGPSRRVRRPIHTQYCDNNKINALLWFCTLQSSVAFAEVAEQFRKCLHCLHPPVYDPYRAYIK